MCGKTESLQQQHIVYTFYPKGLELHLDMEDTAAFRHVGGPFLELFFAQNRQYSYFFSN